MILATIFLVSALAGQAPASGSSATDPAPPVTKEDVDKFAASCGERKFESSASFEHQGKTRSVKILLCAKPQDSNAVWIATLEKATVSVMKSTDLGPAGKEKLINELNAEIARLRAQNN